MDGVNSILDRISIEEISTESFRRVWKWNIRTYINFLVSKKKLLDSSEFFWGFAIELGVETYQAVLNCYIFEVFKEAED